MENGKDVILILHSYAGIPGCSALKDMSKKEREAGNKKGGVTGLLFVAALLTPVGVPYAKWLKAHNSGGGHLAWAKMTEVSKLQITNCRSMRDLSG